MASVRPGDVLAGKYRVERVLGQGGMGYVVAARHLQLDQLVAMKFLRHGALDEGEATGRFLREAKAVVKLRNEHIAKVFDVGTLDTGEPYMVMEYLEGTDLSAMVKQPGRARLSIGEAVEYVSQACEALAEAHTLGIIHRDIKLANIFVTTGPAGGPLVKVLDFGISKTNPFGESEHDMTRTASMLGSPRFMSPEQMRDPRAVDARSDIWSLGVVLYRLVAGKPPFEAETLGRLLTMVMHEEPDALSTLIADLPPGFEQVVFRCLTKDPNQRFSNVAELAYAMAPYAIDAQRARGSADWIASTLSVAALPRTGSSAVLPSSPSMSSIRNSAPPGQSDTGTAAPWAGTHGGGVHPAKSPVIWASVAFVCLLVGGGLFAKVSHDRKVAASQDTAPQTAATGAITEVPPQIAQATPPPTSPPALTAPTIITGTQPTPANTTSAEPKKRQPGPPPAQIQPRKPAPTRPGTGDGIPTTRD